MPDFGRREVLAKGLRNAGHMTVRHDGYAFDLPVVLPNKVHVGGEAPEVFPSGEALGTDHHAVEIGVIGEVGVDRALRPSKSCLLKVESGLSTRRPSDFRME